MKIWITAIAILSITALMGFSTILPVVPNVKQVKKTKEAVTAGLRVYTNKCQTCHENTEITMTNKSYARMMPLLAEMVDMEKLNKKEIEEVAAYVYSVSKK